MTLTAVHHRETPERINAGLSDAGVVWKTEVLEAQRVGADIGAVTLPDEDSLRGEVAYVIGALNGSPRRNAADAFLAPSIDQPLTAGPTKRRGRSVRLLTIRRLCHGDY
jgi:hypothetical protein